jgi:hypothetical protein
LGESGLLAGEFFGLGLALGGEFGEGEGVAGAVGGFEDDIGALHAFEGSLDGFAFGVGPGEDTAGGGGWGGRSGGGGGSGFEVSAFLDPGFEEGDFGRGEAVFAFWRHDFLVVVGEGDGVNEGAFGGFASFDVFLHVIDAIDGEFAFDLVFSDAVALGAFLIEDGEDLGFEVNGEGAGGEAG